MTEEEWLACTDPRTILGVLQQSLGSRKPPAGTARKLRLFVAACFRRAWASLLTEPARRMVEGLERCADGSMTLKELETIDPSTPFLSLRESADPRQAAFRAIYEAARGAVAAASKLEGGVFVAELAAQTALARDILPSPFSLAVPVPACMTPTVASLAASAYEERILPVGQLDPDLLAVLSDALEEAGCDDAAIQGHLRSPGPHVRGCWAVDLLSGRGGTRSTRPK